MAHASDPYALADEDRLPWLEPVDDYEEPERGGAGRLIAFALVALALAAAVIGGIWWWQNREVEPTGSGDLIAAPEGPYKVKPSEEGGMKIEGQGDMAFATSEGAQVQGALDLNAVPEAPVERAPTPAAAEPKPSQSARASISEGSERLVAKAPTAPLAPEGPAGATVQLGAFPTEAVAKKTGETMSKRFAYLADLTPAVLKAEVNGRTYYRLRVTTGSAAQAKDICARLRVAGENCLVVN
jgi:hypothetical protein